MGYRNAPDEPGRPSGSARRADSRLRVLSRGESGQSLVVIVISMTLIVAVAALAIDASDWFAKHHQAQVTADAAALAAANYMGVMSNVPGGGSTDSATSTATTYAAANSLPISRGNVNVDPSSETVTVTVPTTGPLFFAGISLGSGPSISARAVASWKYQDCAAAGSNCAFIYAGDNVCGGDTGVSALLKNKVVVIQHGVTVEKSGSSGGISGDVISASSITTDVNAGTFSAVAAYPTTDSSGAKCSGPNPASPSPFAAAVQRAVISQYPIDYSKTYAACSGSSCDGNGYPKYCTSGAAYEGQSTVTSVPAGGTTVYCNAGTGNPADPSTWNGTTTVTAGGTVNATFIAGAINFSVPTGTTMGPASGTRLLAYAAECNASRPTTCPSAQTGTTSSPVISVSSNGNATLTGDFFAPAGVIDTALGGNPSVTGFLEGWDIVYNANGTVVGDGPQVNSQAQFIGDYLIQ